MRHKDTTIDKGGMSMKIRKIFLPLDAEASYQAKNLFRKMWHRMLNARSTSIVGIIVQK